MWLAPSQLTIPAGSRQLGFYVQLHSTDPSSAASKFIPAAHVAAPVTLCGAHTRRDAIAPTNGSRKGSGKVDPTDSREIGTPDFQGTVLSMGSVVPSRCMVRVFVSFERHLWPWGVPVNAGAVYGFDRTWEEAGGSPRVEAIRRVQHAKLNAMHLDVDDTVRKGWWRWALCASNTGNDQRHDGRWPLVPDARCPPTSAPRLIVAWMLHGLICASACLILLHFVTVVLEQEADLQGKSIGEYNVFIARAVGISLAQTLFIQEPFKVLCITCVSPQMLPYVKPLEGTKCRAAARLSLRGVLGCIYSVLIFLG